MTIRRRLTSSFLAILLLFSVNLAVYYWGNSQKRKNLVEMRMAVTRAQLLTSIERELGDRRQELGVLGQLAESGASALTQAQVAAVRERLALVSAQIAQLSKLSPTDAAAVNALIEVYNRLKVAWTSQYEGFAAGAPIRTPTGGADPAVLSDRALQQLSDLEIAEQRGVDQTTAQFLTLVALTDRTSV